ncbi:MAG: restriction endonuclease subunit S [Desulfobaccales bacterium]
MERYDLPERWEWKKIGEIAKVVSGSTPKTNVAEYWNGNILWATPKDLGKLNSITIDNTERTITELGLNSCSAQILPPGSVLLTSRAPIGHLAINTKPMCTNQGFKNLIPGPEIYNRYLYWVLKFSVRDLQHIGRGGTFEEISKSMVESFEIPLPPLAEQKRIVARIEELTRRVEEMRRLRRETIENITYFLDSSISRIFRANGGWQETTLGKVLTLVQYGLSSKLTTEPHGYPVIRMGNIKDGRVVTDDLKYLDIPTSEASKYILKKGDILINRTNSAELVGKAGLFQEDGKYLFASYLIRLRVNPEAVAPAFINYYINSPDGQAFLKTQGKDAIGQTNINAKQIRQMPVSLPPLDEQRRLVQYLDYLQQKANGLKQLQAETEAELAAFTPALLAKAFRGEL